MDNTELIQDIRVETGEPGKYVELGGGEHAFVQPTKVIGQITRGRVVLYYELQFIRDAIFNIKRATPSTMLGCIKILEEKVQQITVTIDRVLNDYGDTDPSHKYDDEGRVIIPR